MSITLVHLIGPVFFGAVFVLSLAIIIAEIAAARHAILRALSSGDD